MKAEIENPWVKMPRRAPFVLPEDEQFVAAFNAALGENFRDLHTIVGDVPPGAFVGPFDAPVVLLLANPGLDPSDRIEQCTPQALDLIYENLSCEVGSPGWVFDDHFADTACGRWWRSRTRDLSKELGGYDVLAERLLVIEFHGYHSKSWIAPLVTFPSQHFGFRLVRQAMDRGALVMLGQAMRYWYAAVPGLHDYENKIERVASSRLVNLSARNLGPDFWRVVTAFQNISWANPRHGQSNPELEKRPAETSVGGSAPRRRISRDHPRDRPPLAS